MLRIDRENQRLISLEMPTLADISISERYHLQEFISGSPAAFFKEIGQELYVVGKEIEPSTNVQDRIDLLAVDKEGTGVVIELKRGTHRLHMLQALSYAAMIAQWEPDDFFRLLGDDRREALTDFLEVEKEQINRQQRIILIAEAFDYALLVGAEWLSEQYGVNIMCCRIAVATDPATKVEYLVCSNVYPAPEIAAAAAPRGRRTGTVELKWSDWNTALAGVSNPAVVDFFQQQIEAKRESHLRKRNLHYRLENKRRWTVFARSAKAHVWQRGRFEGDVDFWKVKVGLQGGVSEVRNGKGLGFDLTTADDFRLFHDTVTKGFGSIDWLEGSLGEPMEDSDNDGQ